MHVFRRMLKYAAVEDQPVQGRARNQLMDDEQPIYDKLTDPQFVETSIKLLSLEENKGKDRFHAKHFTLFKVHLRLACFWLIKVKGKGFPILDTERWARS